METLPVGHWQKYTTFGNSLLLWTKTYFYAKLNMVVDFLLFNRMPTAVIRKMWK